MTLKIILASILYLIVMFALTRRYLLQKKRMKKFEQHKDDLNKLNKG